MYSHNCTYLPSKPQPPLSDSLSHNLKLLRNFTTGPSVERCSHFSNSSTNSIHFDSFSKINEKDPVSSKAIHTSRPVMDSVYSFKDTSRMNIQNFTMKSPRPRQNYKDFPTYYNTVTTMQLIPSHLVGGFVGSKSQLGRRSTKGFGVKMWDIIRGLVDLVGRPDPFSVHQKDGLPLIDDSILCNPHRVNYQKVGTEPNDNNMESSKSNCIEASEQLIQKQTYADVAKSKLPALVKMHELNVLERHKDLRQFGSSRVPKESQMSHYAIEPNSIRTSVSSMNSQNKPNYSPDRDRIASECSADSEDSFIVFENCEGDSTSVIGDDSEEDSCSSDDENVLDFHTKEDSCSDCSPKTNHHFGVPNKPVKKVRFAEEKNLVELHPMVTWDFAYRRARCGPWETFARDSERFRTRIRNTETILQSVLSPNHRQEVYLQRFAGDSDR